MKSSQQNNNTIFFIYLLVYHIPDAIIDTCNTLSYLNSNYKLAHGICIIFSIQFKLPSLGYTFTMQVRAGMQTQICLTLKNNLFH